MSRADDPLPGDPLVDDSLRDDALLKLVRSYVAVPDVAAARIARAWGMATDHGAGTVLLRPGQTCRHVYFLDAGYARFFAESEERDATRHFVLPGMLFTVHVSFHGAQPAREGLQCITPARVRRVSREAYLRLAAACPVWEAFRRAYVREVYDYLDRTLDIARRLTAQERYAAFVRDYPEVLLHCPLHHVASYLGMTPQSLSRVRAQG